MEEEEEEEEVEEEEEMEGEEEESNDRIFICSNQTGCFQLILDCYGLRE